MKTKLSLLFLSIWCVLASSASTRVIAHRGYWNYPGSAQNSIAALQNAARIGVYGSEFDVLMTADGVLVVNHDDTIDGMDIQTTPYEQLRNCKLKNGETLSTLESYLQEGAKHPRLKLILELKPHRSAEQEMQAVKEVLRLVREKNLEQQTEFISFSLPICSEFLQQSKQPVAYLNGELSPSELKEKGFSDMDYHFQVFAKHPEWLEQARENGIRVNTWTINDLSVMQRLIGQQVDYLTTDFPEETLLMIEKQAKQPR